MTSTILLVEDDARYAARLQKNLLLEGYQVETAASGEEALEACGRTPFDLVITDVKMPGMSGVELLKRLIAMREADDTELPVILLTSVDSVQTAVEAMKAGASDYITKDADRDEIMLRVEKVLAGAQMHAENKRLRTQIQVAGETHPFIAQDPKSRAILQEIDNVAETGAGILIAGETGVGKDLIARMIHQKSPRRDQSYVDVNCAALPTDNLFQSEVFGHEKGAFTGAMERKRGKLELADGGTLFLDEIGDMPLESQGKILRALETQEFERVGGTQKIRVNLAVIAATNKNLEQLMRSGQFRQDLLYRLDIIRLVIPPLRERKNDIIPLAHHFFASYARKYRRPAPELTPDAKELLLHYSYPGNVRELKNLVERMVIRHRECLQVTAELLRREGLLPDIQVSIGDGDENGGDDLPSLEEMEKQHILTALERSNWVQSEAARLLKISPDRMNNRVKKYGIHHPSWRTHK